MGIAKAGTITAALLLTLICAGCVNLTGAERPTTWAQPVEVEGVPDLYKVTEGIYRSGQPTPLGLKNLKAMGIKTVINVRDFHSNREEVLEAGLDYERIRTRAYYIRKKEVIQFLKIVTDSSRTPVLVHCWLSSDRSGFLIAVYRIVMQSWSKDEAIREMVRGNFGFHRIFFNVPIWIKFLDVEEIKMAAGMKDPPPKLHNQDRQKN
jgi:protein tyrosine phosphatase (PTP) superfamily phosphohydrolase (DUF442 family)